MDLLGRWTVVANCFRCKKVPRVTRGISVPEILSCLDAIVPFQKSLIRHVDYTITPT